MNTQIETIRTIEFDYNISILELFKYLKSENLELLSIEFDLETQNLPTITIKNKS
jgi:hypothetical protein